MRTKVTLTHVLSEALYHISRRLNVLRSARGLGSWNKQLGML